MIMKIEQYDYQIGYTVVTEVSIKEAYSTLTCDQWAELLAYGCASNETYDYNIKEGE